MEFDFIKPKAPNRDERRAILRSLQSRLLERVAKRLGVPANQVMLVRGQTELKAVARNGQVVRFEQGEEQALRAAQQWEKSGEGEAPKLPL